MIAAELVFFYFFFVTKIPSRMGEQMALLVMAAVGDHVVMVVEKVLWRSRSALGMWRVFVLEQAVGDQGRELEKGKVVIPINWDLTPPFLPLFSVACFVMLPFPAGPGVPALGEAICVKRWGRRK